MNSIQKTDHLHKGIQISVLVHLLAIITIISINNSIPANTVMQIDFRMENTADTSNKSQETVSRLIKQEKIKSVQQTEPKHSSAAVSPSISENQAPVPAPIASQEIKEQRYSETQSINNSSSSVKEAVKVKVEPASTGNSIESVKQIYLKEHFNYIRDLIQKKLIYPNIARRMGWTGKVVVSFVISTDGNVKDIKITEGSGFELLDKNTIEIVKKTSPFPKPPVEAQLMIPVTYNLN
ncbi:MAG: hypothetical protein A2X59_13030 [Nitrospirae bacterium GWC2_42_7]|nr:MAG: hypothetical protein A2X59_13030 [Nitrospirae bacterium GWC2_42_7]